MSNITRPVGNIGVTQYIDPGVQDNSMAQGLAAIGGAALDIDQRIGERALENELTAMRDLYESKSFALGSETDDDSGIAPADRAEIGAESERIGVLQRAVQQGTLSNDLFRLKAEAALRAAIARRPGLAQEYRQLAASTLGMDVSGAAIEQLAQAEARIASSQQAGITAAADQQSKDDDEVGKRALAAIGSTQLPNLNPFRTMPARQLGAMVREDPLFAATVQELQMSIAAGEQAKLAAQRTTDEVTAGRIGKDLEGAATLHGFRAGMGSWTMRIRNVLSDGTLDLEQDIPEVNAVLDEAMQGALAVRETLSANLPYMTPDVADRYFREVDDMVKMVQDIKNQGQGMTKEALDSLISHASYVTVKGSSAALSYTVAKDLYGDRFFEFISGQSDEAKQAFGMHMRHLAGSNMPPESLAAGANEVVSQLATYVGQNKELSQFGVENMGRSLNTVVSAFIDMPSQHFRAGAYGGPTGLTSRLGSEFIGKTLASKLPETERNAIGNRILIANRRALDAVKMEWQRSGRGEATFELRPDGSFIQTADPSMASSARALEARILSTPSMIKAASIFTGKPEAEVIQLMNNVRVPEPAPRNTTPPLISRPTTNTNVQSVADELRNAWGM
jgi:hypothetical protein